MRLVSQFPATQWKGDDFYAPPQDLDLIRKYVTPNKQRRDHFPNRLGLPVGDGTRSKILFCSLNLGI